MGMNTNDRSNWTDKQRAAYELLMSRPVRVPTEAERAAFQAPRTISFGKAPKGGWTDADRVPTK